MRKQLIDCLHHLAWHYAIHVLPQPSQRYVYPSAACALLSAFLVMLASGIGLGLIETVIRQKHDSRVSPRNPPLSSWADLLKPVAAHHGRFVLAPRLVERWRAKLAGPDASPCAARLPS